MNGVDFEMLGRTYPYRNPLGYPRLPNHPRHLKFINVKSATLIAKTEVIIQQEVQKFTDVLSDSLDFCFNTR